jgi:Domain of unknown function (DUF4259)
MGAWGHAPFDNDDAADWVADLERAPDDELLERTLTAVAAAGADEYVEEPDGASAIAAAEVVAAALTGSRDRLEAGGPFAEGAVAWVEARGAGVRPELAGLALTALRRVRDKSELRELWDDAGADDWLAELAALEGRLEQAA